MYTEIELFVGKGMLHHPTKHFTRVLHDLARRAERLVTEATGVYSKSPSQSLKLYTFILPFRPDGFWLNMRYFPRISWDSLKIFPNCEQISKFKVQPIHIYLSKREDFFCVWKGISMALIWCIGPLWSVDTFWYVLFWKNVEILEKRPFFRADMAGLGKYHMGGYGLIGVYRVLLAWPIV